MITATAEEKKKYVEYIHEELRRRGVRDNDISRVIGKTGFLAALEEYPDVQMHYDVSDAVDEILLTAALH